MFFESHVGEVLAETKIPRADLFIQTKFVSLPHHKPFLPPYPPYEENKANEACQLSLFRSLENLKTTYVDAFLINAPDLTVTPMTNLLSVLQHAKSQRLARYTGLCNVPTIGVLRYLHRAAPGVIQIVQNPLHSPWDPEYEIHQYCRDNGIQYNAFHTLTTSDRIIKESKITAIAKERYIPPALVFLQFCVQSDIAPLVGARSEKNLRSVIPLATGELPPLTNPEMKVITRFMAEQTVISRYQAVLLLRRLEKLRKRQQGRNKMIEDQKTQLRQSIAEREKREQEIVQRAKIRATAMADRLRAETVEREAKEEKKRAEALKLSGSLPEECEHGSEDTEKNEPSKKDIDKENLDDDADKDDDQPTLPGGQGRSRKDKEC